MRTTINVEEQFAPAIDPDKDLNTLALPPFTDEGLHKGASLFCVASIVISGLFLNLDTTHTGD